VLNVLTTTYKELTTDISKVDLLVIDVEGHEESVLKGMVGCKLPSVICIEYPITGIRKITRILTYMGYRFDFISFNNAFFSFNMPAVSKFGETQPLACYRDE
jgi:hypothetical protein